MAAGLGLEFLEDALAAHRLTRLVIEDTVTDRARTALKHEGPPWVGTLLECPWCAGFWVSVAVATARVAAPKAWRPVARVLALSSAAGLLSSRETA